MGSPIRGFLLLVPMLVLAAVAPSRMTTIFAQRSDSTTAPRTIATVEEARAHCATSCHAFPPPEILPRAAWRMELVRMLLLQEGVPEPAGAADYIPLPPDWLPLLRYYETHAPVRLADPEPWPPTDRAGLHFERRSLAPRDGDASPAVANARWLDVDQDGRLDVVATDMRLGKVFVGLARAKFALEPVATLRHPARVELVDLDKDGIQDLLVADLGSFQPADHDRGSVSWLRGRKDGGFTPVELARGLARVADARPADFDGDGDLDVVLAVFGWRRTGNIVILENKTRSWDSPSFEARVVDTRTGAIHVPIADLNGDGHLDFVALLAQEHESVVAFVNSGKGLAFTPTTIYAAPHPNWGSSGIGLVDLDKDGDLDVLLTHGDTFDDFVLKPYHGIQWLENDGRGHYTAHTLASLPGAQRARAADMDGDGDLDIVASAMVAGGGGDFGPRLASLVWLEQTSPRTFERRTIEVGMPYHATLDVADYDQDGDQDLVVGWFAFAGPISAWVDIWESTRRR